VFPELGGSGSEGATGTTGNYGTILVLAVGTEENLDSLSLGRNLDPGSVIY
jgi:hypothetical protein